MKVLVTGAAGFIGSNLSVRLRELGHDVLSYSRSSAEEMLDTHLRDADVVVHLAGENRPSSSDAFETTNVLLTRKLCESVRNCGRNVPLLLASSTQAELENPYGQSKLRAEQLVEALGRDCEVPVIIYRLPGVFGKWCRPNYNSVVATFCHNIARGLPIQVNDPARLLSLVYIDDVVQAFQQWVSAPGVGARYARVTPEYTVTLGELAAQLRSYASGRSELRVGPVGIGLARALYATYVSHLPPSEFSYEIPAHKDPRGVFVEMLKTPDAGQLSYFTAYPGVTRGGHYHHTKTEKFLVLKGVARFRFRNIVSGETVSLDTCGDVPRIVDTIPGWAHDITNIGNDELLVMLWANEVFDKQRPDTIANRV